MDFEVFKNRIKAGDKPVVTGMSFTLEQYQELEPLITDKAYLKFAIESRVRNIKES